MAEQLDLSAPVSQPTITSYTVQSILLDRQHSVIHIDVVSNTGRHIGHEYTGATAQTLLVQLNKADLSVKSLQKRVLEKLSADGVLVGTVSGTPD